MKLKRIQLGGVRDLHIDQSAIETILDAVEVNTANSIYYESCKHITSFNVPNIDKTSHIQKFKSADYRLEIIYEENPNGMICDLCDDERIARNEPIQV